MEDYTIKPSLESKKDYRDELTGSTYPSGFTKEEADGIIKTIVQTLANNKDRAFKQWELTAMFDQNINGATFRKLIQIYRENPSNYDIRHEKGWIEYGFVVASSNGYKFTNNKEEITTYLNALDTRRRSLQKQILSAEVEMELFAKYDHNRSLQKEKPQKYPTGNKHDRYS